MQLGALASLKPVGLAGRLETQAGAGVAVLRQNFYFLRETSV